MGGSVSGGHSNAELVYNLATQHASTKSSLVEQLMLGVDRRAYFLPDFDHFAYQDLAWKHNLLHLSAPVIYWEVLDQLQLKPSLSFLNLGSGTGYLSTMAGLILGPNGINHGVELHQEVIDFAHEKLEEFKRDSESMDRYDFCEPQFVQGNCLYLPPDVRQYDRVYVGAACPEDKETYMKNLLKVGGILVMPYRDYLVQIKRVGPNEFKTTRSMQVAFSSLQDPPAESAAPVAHVKLPELHPRDLRDLARCRIRQLLRKCCETECPEVMQLKRFIPKRDVRSRLRVCSSNPGDMHQIISVGYSEQTDDDDNMSDNQSLEDHHFDDNDIYEVRTLDPPTDSEASHDETNANQRETKETSLNAGGEKKDNSKETDTNDKDERLELEEKLENVLKVSKEEQDTGRDEDKRKGAKHKHIKDREEERKSAHSKDGRNDDDGACSSKSVYRKTSPSSYVQKYVDKEPLTKLESARKFKQLLDDITENRCPGSSRKEDETFDRDNNEKSTDGSGLDKEVRSGIGSVGNRMADSESELDDIGKDATEPTKKSDIESDNKVWRNKSDVDNISVKKSHEIGSSKHVNKSAGDRHVNVADPKRETACINKSSKKFEEPMDGINEDCEDTNEKHIGASSENIVAKHLMDTSSEDIKTPSKSVMINDKITPLAPSAISFKREKTDSGVVDDDLAGDNNSIASLDSSGGSLDSGISSHSALNAYMDSVREMKKTYADVHKAQSSFLKSLMISARDQEENGTRSGENSRRKTLGELFGDGSCTFGASSSCEEGKTNIYTSASSGNAKDNLSTKNNSSISASSPSCGTNKADLSESDSRSTVKVSTHCEGKDIDETMESEDQPQPCSSEHVDNSENKSDDRSECNSHSNADGNRYSKKETVRHDNGTDLSYWNKKKSYPNQENNRNNSETGNSREGKERSDRKSPEKRGSKEEKLPYPTYAELQAIRQKLLAKIRDRSRATSPNDSSESDVESYFSNGRFENHSESRFGDQSRSSEQSDNYKSEECKSSGRNENYNASRTEQRSSSGRIQSGNSETRIDRSKPSGSKVNFETKPSDARCSGDARMSEDDRDGETYESKRKYTTDSEQGDDECESNDDRKESSKKNKKFKDRNSVPTEEEERRRSAIEVERLARAAQAAQRRDGLLNFLDEPPARPLFHVFNRGMFEVMSPLRRGENDEEVISEDDDDEEEEEDCVLKDLDKEEDDGRPTYTTLIKEKIQALPLPNLVKKYLNFDREF
ncbi:hypothetical protein WDU94_006239 [Cyamophila willieti]